MSWCQVPSTGSILVVFVTLVVSCGTGFDFSEVKKTDAVECEGGARCVIAQDCPFIINKVLSGDYPHVCRSEYGG